MPRRRIPPLDTDPWEALRDVAHAYYQQFGKEVWTWRMDPARIPALAAAMKAALAAGRPLSVNEAAAVTKVTPPLRADG
jgi:hypothetical protein